MTRCGCNAVNHCGDPTHRGGRSFTAPVDGVQLVENSGCPIGESVPMVELEEVFHVGTLDAGDRASWSYEGNGLSVSVHPDEWARIARLGGTATWSLTRPDSQPLRFVSWHDVDETTRQDVTDWACGAGWIEEVEVVKATWMEDDDNGDLVQHWADFASVDEAVEELEARLPDPDDPEHEISLKRTNAWRATDEFPDERTPRDVDPTDVTFAAYIRANRPDIDGVWWEDEYAPDRLSCPRGVIVHDLTGYTSSPA